MHFALIVFLTIIIIIICSPAFKKANIQNKTTGVGNIDKYSYLPHSQTTNVD